MLVSSTGCTLVSSVGCMLVSNGGMLKSRCLPSGWFDYTYQQYGLHGICQLLCSIFACCNKCCWRDYSCKHAQARMWNAALLQCLRAIWDMLLVLSETRKSKHVVEYHSDSAQWPCLIIAAHAKETEPGVPQQSFWTLMKRYCKIQSNNKRVLNLRLSPMI